MARVRKSVIKASMSPTDILMRKIGEKRFGAGNTMTGEDIFSTPYGIPLDGCIPLQFVAGIDIIPLEYLLGVVGEAGVGKSTFAWWVAGQVMRAGGFVVGIEVEKKTNWDVVKGLIPEDLRDSRLQVHNLKFIDEAFSCIEAYANQYEDVWPEKNVPLLILMDSLGALIKRDSHEDMVKNGFAGKGFDGAQRAGDITKSMQVAEGFLWDRPVSYLFINHLKVKLDAGGGANYSPGPPKKAAPGGDHMKYTHSVSFELSKGSPKTGVKSEKIRTVYIKAHKTAFGSDANRIAVELHIKQANQKLDVWYDWDSSLIDLLEAGKGFLQTDLNEVLPFNKNTKGAYTCERLGLDKVSKRELGAAIHADQQVVSELHDVLSIMRKRKFEPKISS